MDLPVAVARERYEATPLVVDGVMYTVQNPDDVLALDAVTGRIYWTYNYHVFARRPPVLRTAEPRPRDPGRHAVHRHHRRARDRARRQERQAAVERRKSAMPRSGYAITHAPLIVKDKVIVGMAGGEYGIRGYILALDAKTGKEAWRFYTIPGPGEPGHETWKGDSWKHGGASVWVTGSYDPDTNLTFWGIGNPGPDWNGDNRAGDNLYSRLGGRARRRHGQAQVVLPVLAARRVRLRLDADSGAGRYRLAGPPAQGDDVGQSQRLVLRAGPHQRPVSARASPS